jgi:hypothetical protein
MARLLSKPGYGSQFEPLFPAMLIRYASSGRQTKRPIS